MKQYVKWFKDESDVPFGSRFIERVMGDAGYVHLCKGNVWEVREGFFFDGQRWIANDADDLPAKADIKI